MASVDTINASSSSSSLPFNNVFLSFRGSDSGANFTDHLYCAMRQRGIRTFRDEGLVERGRSVHSELVRAIEGSKFAVIVFSRNYASSTWCLAELAKIVDCMEKKKLIVLPIFYHVDPSDVWNQTGALADAFAKHEERFKDSIEDVNLWRLALRKAASISGFVSNDGGPERQLIAELIESLCNLSNQMPEDGSTKWDLPPRFDDSPDEADDADDDADEMVQDYVADLPLIGLENESLYNLSNGEVQLITNFVESLSNLSIQMLEDGSNNFDLPPRFDDSQDEADNDADEMVQDYVADLPLEVHVVQDDVADVPQEAHVVEDHVAYLPLECAICVTNVKGMAFHCGHMTCVECAERLDRCPICRKQIIDRIRLYFV